jgi:hypothetical protein
MGAPFQHTRSKIRHGAVRMKGHLGNAYVHVKGGLELADNVIHTVRTVHSAVAPLIDHTRQGAILNDTMKNWGNTYDAIREKVVEGDRVGNAVVSLARAVHKHPMGIGL